MAEAEKIKKDDMVTVYGTAKSKSMKTGKSYRIHRELAKKLVKKGDATTDAPKAKADK